MAGGRVELPVRRKRDNALRDCPSPPFRARDQGFFPFQVGHKYQSIGARYRRRAAVQAALLALQVVEITLPFRIGHAFVATLRVVGQAIVVLAAIPIAHLSVSALFVPAEPSEFEVYCRVRAEAARVACIEPGCLLTTVAVVATDAGVTVPIGRSSPVR
jgi:hypothetical protein